MLIKDNKHFVSLLATVYGIFTSIGVAKIKAFKT